MEFNTLRHEVEDGILTVYLDRPDNLNAFTVEMAEELERTFVEVNDDDAVRAVIVTGSGRAFCAGMDLSSSGNVFGLDESKSPSLAAMADLDDPELVRVRDTGGRVTLAIYGCRKPVIAAVNGAAVGIGATMMLAMDARLFSTKARFGLVFGKLGITPEACSTWFLPRIVGTEKALDLFYRAAILDAKEAQEVGLVRTVVPAADLLTTAIDFARELVTGRSAVSIALIRQMVLSNSAQPHPRPAHDLESLAMFYTAKGDGKEGVAAFLEKRSPEFGSRASQMPPFHPWNRN